MGFPTSQVQVNHLLAGAKKVVASVRYCWLLTEAETGGANARPMGRLLPGPNENDWMIRFITGGLSRKALDIRRASKVGLIFQDADDAFVVWQAEPCCSRVHSVCVSFGRTTTTSISLTRRTEPTQLSLRSTLSGWSSGFGVSRQSCSDCGRQFSNGLPQLLGD